MAKNSDIVNEISKHTGIESGHAKNVANFEVLVAECLGYGTTYNPNKASIKVPAMQTLLTTAKNATSAVNSAIPAYRTTRDARETAFEPLSILITRVFNALKASDVTIQIVNTAKTYTRKIQGRRASPKKALDAFINATTKDSTSGTTTNTTTDTETTVNDTIETHEQISASQMNYDNRLDNLDKLVKLLSTITAYSPNEAELKITTLNTLLNDLKTKNTAVINATIPLTNARFSRNDILYKDSVGLYYVARDSKIYIKSLYGARSPQYKLICRLKFTKPKK